MRVRDAWRVMTWAVLLLLAAAALVVGSQRHGPPPSLAERVNALAVGVRCPVCGGQNVADSNTYAAQAIKTDITRRLRSGETPTQVRAYLVSRYGTRILESPPASGISGLVWWVPAVAIPAAAVGLLVALRRSRPAPAPPLSEADRALVDAALRCGAGPLQPEPTEVEPTEALLPERADSDTNYETGLASTPPAGGGQTDGSVEVVGEEKKVAELPGSTGPETADGARLTGALDAPRRPGSPSVRELPPT